MNKSFEILATQFRPMLLGYLTTLARDEHTADDLVQETFVAAQKSLERFEAEGDFGAWLRGIARNKFLEHQRKVARQSTIVDSRVVEGIDEVYAVFDQPGSEAWHEKISVMNGCISELNEGMRKAIDLIYRRGTSTELAAKTLNLTTMAIGQRMSRARKLIFECVQRRG